MSCTRNAFAAYQDFGAQGDRGCRCAASMLTFPRDDRRNPLPVQQPFRPEGLQRVLRPQAVRALGEGVAAPIFGAANPSSTSLAAVRLGAEGRVVATDIAQPMLDIAKAKAPPGGAPIEYLNSPAAPLRRRPGHSTRFYVSRACSSFPTVPPRYVKCGAY